MRPAALLPVAASAGAVVDLHVDVQPVQLGLLVAAPPSSRLCPLELAHLLPHEALLRLPGSGDSMVRRLRSRSASRCGGSKPPQTGPPASRQRHAGLGKGIRAGSGKWGVEGGYVQLRTRGC